MDIIVTGLVKGATMADKETKEQPAAKEEEQEPTSLSATHEQMQFNAEILSGQVKTYGFDDYLRKGIARGAIPSDLTPSQRKAIEQVYNSLVGR
jgi:hypothetical protein